MSQTVDPDPLIGRVVAGKMELIGLLGAGAMGKVYRARHKTLDKIVAIKVLHAEAGVSPSVAARFKAEARAASRLDHPNSLRILDFGDDGDDKLLYIAMEFLEGVTLQSVLSREGRLPPERTAWIIGQVCSALAAAHDRGVVHRDIKPSNVMLTIRRGDRGMIQDFVKVCDFGLAKVLDTNAESSSSGPLTQQGAVLGTPAYMSPEQAKGEKVDHRTDIYSVGVILYRMLSGQKPFVGDSAWAVSLKQIADEPQPIREVAPDLSEELAAVIHKTMQKDPGARYQTARDLKHALVEACGLPEMDSQESGTHSAAAFVDPTAELDPTFVPHKSEQTQEAVPDRSADMPDASRHGKKRSVVLAVAALTLVLGTIAGIGIARVAKDDGGAPHPKPTETIVIGDPPPPPEPTTIVLSVFGAPDGTRVLCEGKALGTLPEPIELPRTDDPMSITFEAEGHEGLTRTIIPDRDLHMSVALRPVEPPPPAAPPPPKKHRRRRHPKKPEKKKNDRHSLENPFDD